jgi:hypothetical protein
MNNRTKEEARLKRLEKQKIRLEQDRRQAQDIRQKQDIRPQLAEKENADIEPYKKNNVIDAGTVTVTGNVTYQGNVAGKANITNKGLAEDDVIVKEDIEEEDMIDEEDVIGEDDVTYKENAAAGKKYITAKGNPSDKVSAAFIQKKQSTGPDAERKQLEERIDEEFLPGFKSLLSTKYSQLKKALDEQLDLAKKAEEALAKKAEEALTKKTEEALAKKTQEALDAKKAEEKASPGKPYSLDVFIKTTDYLIELSKQQQKKVMEDSNYDITWDSPEVLMKAADYLQNHKDEAVAQIKEAEVVWPADTLSRHVKELKELKDEIEQHEKQLIKDYRDKMVHSLQKGDRVEKKSTAQSEKEEIELKRSIIKAIQTAAEIYFKVKAQNRPKKRDSFLQKFGSVVFVDEEMKELIFSNGYGEVIGKKRWILPDEQKKIRYLEAQKDHIWLELLKNMENAVQAEKPLIEAQAVDKAKVLQAQIDELLGNKVLSRRTIHNIEDYLVKTKSLSELEKLFNDVMKECEEHRSALRHSSQSRDILIEQAKKLVINSPLHVKFDDILRIEHEMLIKDIPVEVKVQSVTSKRSQEIDSLLTQAESAKASFDSRFALKHKQLNADIQKSTEVLKVADIAKEFLIEEAVKVNQNIAKVIRACDKRLKAAEVILQSLKQIKKEAAARCQEMEAIILNGVNNGNLESSELELFVADMKEKSSAINKKLEEVNTILHHKEEPQPLKSKPVDQHKEELQPLKSKPVDQHKEESQPLKSKPVDQHKEELQPLKSKPVDQHKKESQSLESKSVHQLHALASSQLQQSRDFFQVPVYQKGGKYQEAFHLIDGKKSAQEKAKADFVAGWSIVFKASAIITAYAQSALKYSKTNKNIRDLLDERKITDCQIQKVLDARSELLEKDNNGLGMGDLISIQSIKESAETDYKAAQASFDKVKRLLRSAEENKLEAQNKFDEAKKTYFDFSAVSYQAMADYANNQYEKALQEKMKIEDRLNAAGQALKELQAYAECVKKNEKLTETLNQLSAVQAQVKDICKELENTSVEVKVEVKPDEIEAKTGEIGVIDTKVEDAKIDIKATDAKAIDAKAIDAKAIDAKAIDAKAIDAKAIDAKAIDAKATDAKATDAKATHLKTTHAKAINTDITDAKAREVKTRDDHIRETQATIVELKDINVLPSKIHDRVKAFFTRFEKAEELLSEEKTKKEQCLEALTALKKVIVEQGQEEKNQMGSLLKAKFSQCSLIVSAREKELNQQTQDPLSSILSKKIPERIMWNYSDAVAMQVAMQQKERIERKRADDKKIVAYIKKFLETKKEHLSREIPIGGTQLKGCDVKIQKRLAQIYNDVLSDDKKTESDQLNEIEGKIKDRLGDGYGFFRKENGLADTFCKVLAAALKSEQRCFDGIKEALDRLDKAFSRTTVQSNVGPKQYLRGHSPR